MSRLARHLIGPLLLPEYRLSEPEQVHIMLVPYLHLASLLQGTEWNAHYVASVASVFNVALALSYLNQDRRSINYYSAIQNLVLDLSHGHPFGADEKRRLQRVFSDADRYICHQKKSDILNAINLVEYQIANAAPSEVTVVERA